MGKKSSIIGEFKTFISRGNVMDLAVGLIIGSAFTAIVSSLVNDIVMPIVGTVLGGVNFTDLKFVIRHATADKAQLAIAYGNFLQAVVDFLLIAFVVFILVKTLNSFRLKSEQLLKLKEEEEEKAAPSQEVVVPQDILLLTEIRDLLKKER
jgi:large conductance mechanosensitive channel